MRVLRPEASELRACFGASADLTQLSGIPAAIRPRLAELEGMTHSGTSLSLALRRDGVVVGLLDGDEALRHLLFAVDGRVARGSGDPPLYVATAEDLPPF